MSSSIAMTGLLLPMPEYIFAVAKSSLTGTTMSLSRSVCIDSTLQILCIHEKLRLDQRVGRLLIQGEITCGRYQVDPAADYVDGVKSSIVGLNSRRIPPLLQSPQRLPRLACPQHDPH